MKPVRASKLKQRLESQSTAPDWLSVATVKKSSLNVLIIGFTIIQLEKCNEKEMVNLSNCFSRKVRLLIGRRSLSFGLFENAFRSRKCARTCCFWARIWDVSSTTSWLAIGWPALTNREPANRATPNRKRTERDVEFFVLSFFERVLPWRTGTTATTQRPPSNRPSNRSTRNHFGSFLFIRIGLSETKFPLVVAFGPDCYSWSRCTSDQNLITSGNETKLNIERRITGSLWNYPVLSGSVSNCSAICDP